jgi:Rrf2 family iron-sulfur cluster assembly transcriptional regulator
MWLSGTSQSALRAVLYLAGQPAGRPVPVDEIADALDCPRNYLSKTLYALTRAGVLQSTRGPGGGFRLVDPPGRLAIARVVAPFEPVGERRCLVGRPECGGTHPCQAHNRWTHVATVVEAFFDQTTVADLLRDGGPSAIPAAPPRRRRRRAPQRSK